MDKVIVKIPASTTNLGPGFDVLGMALNLYNIVEMSISNSGLHIEVDGEGTDTISRDETNMVYMSAKRIFERIGEKMPPLNIRLTNNIPLARGLGSSGTAIIGGLVAGNIISSAGLTDQDILNMAAEIDGHPDNVAASIFGGIVIASINNGSVAYMKIVPPKPVKVVVVVPDFHLLTSDARAVLPKTVNIQTAVFNISRTALLVASLATGDFRYLNISTEDKLHQPYRAKLIPGIDDVFDAVKSTDSESAVAISGAGSSIVAFCCNDKSEQIGENMRKAFLKNNIKSYVMIMDIDYNGTEIL